MDKDDFFSQTKVHIKTNTVQPKKLYNLDESLKKLFEKSQTCQYDNLGRDKQNLQETSIENLFETGNWLKENQNEDEAKEFFEIIIDLLKQVGEENTKICSIAKHNMAECFTKMDNFTEAINYYQQSLKIYKQTSSDVDNDRNRRVNILFIMSFLVKVVYVLYNSF